MSEPEDTFDDRAPRRDFNRTSDLAGSATGMSARERYVLNLAFS